MKRLIVIMLGVLTVVALVGCGDQGEVQRIMSATRTAAAGGSTPEHGDQSLLTPEADGTFSMAPTATPVPGATSIPEATATPAPTPIPTPTFTELYRDDVTAALHSYYVAYHSRSQSAMDSATTAATTAENKGSVEEMQASSRTTRGWLDYPDIDIVEVTWVKCDEVLCNIRFDGVSNPPVEDPVMGQDFPFDFNMGLYFRRVNGVFLEDHTTETWHDEWESTHRE